VDNGLVSIRGAFNYLLGIKTIKENVDSKALMLRVYMEKIDCLRHVR